MKLKTSCPSCTASLSVEADLVGKHAKCPKCRTKFVIEEVRTPRSAQSVAEAAVAVETVADGTTTAGAKRDGSPATASGKMLGRFELQGVLGQGGFGRVYKAYDPQLDRVLALKVPTFGPQDVQKAKRFQKEAKAAAQLRHPNIVPTFDSGKAGNQFFIATQFIEGEPLSKATELGPVEPRLAAEWCAKIADALAYAHEMGIVHRDVKPHNVMLDARSEPQLMDFGLAKRVNEDSTMTSEGSLLGTPAYMAPEQARGDTSSIGPHSDQYAVGAILYELLSGQRAFEGAPHVVLTQIVSQEPPGLRSINPAIPQDLEAIAQKAMSKEIDRRYESCEELAADLRSWLRGDPTAARPITQRERLTRWAKRNRGLAMAFGGTALALLLAAGLGVTFAAYQTKARMEISAAQETTAAALTTAETERDNAQKERDAAQQERDRAETEKERAEKERLRAEAQTKLAEERQQAEIEQRELADTRLEEARQTSYISNIRLASAKWDTGDITGMDAALEALRPGPGETDRRGWEWNYLWNLSHSEISSFNIGTPEQKEGAPQRFYYISGISPDGRQVLRSDTQGETCLLDAQTGALLHTFHEIVGSSYQAAFSPDGTRLYICGGGGDISCWNTATGEKQFTATGGPTVRSQSPLSVSGDGTKLANGGGELYNVTGSASGGTYPCIWDASTGKHLTTLALSEVSFHSCVLSPNGQLAAINPISGGLQIYDAETGKLRTNLDAPYCFSPCFSPDGLHLAAGTPNGISIWSVETGAVAATIPLVMPVDHTLFLQYGRDGRFLAVQYHESLAICDARSGTLIHVSKGQGIVHHFCYTSDGRRIVTGGRDGTVKTWDAFSQLEVLETDQGERATRASMIPRFESNGDAIFFAGFGAVYWDLESGQRTEYRSSGQDALVPLETRVIGVSQNGEAYAWNRNTGQKELTLKLPSETLKSLSEGQSGVRFLLDSAISEEELHLWVSVFTASGMAHYLPDKHLFLFLDDDGSIVVLDVQQRTQVQRFTPNVDSPLKKFRGICNFSPAGDIVSIALTEGALFESDSMVIQWSLKTGEKLPKLRNQFLLPDMVVMDAQSTRVFASSRGDVRIWDMKLRDEVLTIRRPFEVDSNNPQSFVAMSPDGSRLAMSVQGKVVIYDGRPESETRTRATERAARSTLAYFRGRTKSQDELLKAIQADPTINDDVRTMAVRFASLPPTKIVELQP